MHSVERDIMVGMIRVLDVALKKSVLTKEQYNERLAELKQFEEETNFMLLNSPNCPIDLQSVVKRLETKTIDSKECNNIEDIIKFANQKDMLVYMGVYGVDMSITYTEGVITKIEIGSALISIKRISNIPYKINKSGTYTVQGKVTVVDSDKMKFLVHNIIKDDSANLKDNLEEAKDLMFDVVPNWLATNFNPKNLQGTIDYIFDLANDEELPCNGVAFRFNDIKDERCVIYRHTSNNE